MCFFENFGMQKDRKFGTLIQLWNRWLSWSENFTKLSLSCILNQDSINYFWSEGAAQTGWISPQNVSIFKNLGHCPTLLVEVTPRQPREMAWHHQSPTYRHFYLKKICFIVNKGIYLRKEVLHCIINNLTLLSHFYLQPQNCLAISIAFFVLSTCPQHQSTCAAPCNSYHSCSNSKK